VRRLTVATALVLGLVAPVAASARTYLYTKHDTTSFGYRLPAYQPKEILLYPNRGRAGEVYDIHWSGWGTNRATGAGKILGIPPEPPSIAKNVVVVASRPHTINTDASCATTPYYVTYYRDLRARVPSRPRMIGTNNFAVGPTIQC
jgi:hypothetical protein